MRSYRIQKALCYLLLTLALAVALRAQQGPTAGVSGIVVDPSDAAAPQVSITLTNSATQLKRNTQTNESGTFAIGLVQPGSYTIRAEKAGFATVEINDVNLSVDQEVSIKIRLKVSSVSEQVIVSEAPPLIQVASPNTTSTLSSQEIRDIPNPGMDFSRLAAVAPGAILNVTSANRSVTANLEFNGLPSSGNDFTIDGLDANDPYLDSNRTGASGLQLGTNALAEVSINTLSYGADKGRLGAAQINGITKSGTNEFHGNGWEIWNGSAMNSRNFFLNADPTHPKKPRSNVNSFGGSAGGPILRNRLFFFTSLEGTRIVLPFTTNRVVPSSAYQGYVLDQLPLGGRDPILGNTYAPQPGQVPLYRQVFGLISNPDSGIPLATRGCPFDVGGGSPAVANTGNGCANRLQLSYSPPLKETLWTLKINHNASSRDMFWYRFQMNNGESRTPDAVNAAFDRARPSNQRSGTASWTHIFGPNLVNEFNPGAFYSTNLETYVDDAKAVAALPLAMSYSPFSTFGNNLFYRLLGVNQFVWQVNDNLVWNTGRHSFKFGENLRRWVYGNTRIGRYQIPLASGCSLATFTHGVACSYSQSFPAVSIDHFRFWDIDTYAMDTIRINTKLTATIGLRLTHISNPESLDKVNARLKTPFEVIPHDVNRPLSQDILPREERLFPATPVLSWQPRASVAYELHPGTVFRMGGGLFQQLASSFSSTYLDLNPPNGSRITSGLNTTLGGTALLPGLPDSAADTAANFNRLFQRGFFGGTLSCASPSAGADCIPATGFTTFNGTEQKFPYFLQWSAGLERQFGSKLVVSANYVGTRALQMFFSRSANNYQTRCEGCFAPYRFNQSLDPRFASVSAFETGTTSSYHALQVSVKQRVSRGLSFRANYTWSHCLDYISNGGISSFNANGSFGVWEGQLALQRGSCDFDVRHSLNGSYLYELPFRARHRALNAVVGGWQVAGTFFVRGGFPVNMTSASASGVFINGSALIRANVVPGQDFYSKKPIPGVTQPGTIQWLNPNAFQSVIDASTNACYPANTPEYCRNGNLGRGVVRAPGFAWTDLALSKRFKVAEHLSVRIEAQAYNIFNHPNFGFPGSGTSQVGIPGKLSTLVNFGTINTTMAPATGLLGGGGRGDTSVRMIAFRGGFEF